MSYLKEAAFRRLKKRSWDFSGLTALIFGFTVICFHLPGRTLAAGVVFESRQSNKYIFSYSENLPGADQTTNYLIREIAKFNLSGLYSTSYTFYYSLDNSIISSAPDQFTISAHITPRECTGDVYYKGFDISDILMPEKVDLKIILIRDKNYIDIRNFEGVSLNPGKKCTIDFDIDVYDESGNYSIQIEDLKFYSTPQSENLFNSRINQIDCYFASVAMMERILNESACLDIRTNTLIETCFRLKELERMFGIISTEPFIKELKIAQNDPVGYYEKLSALKRLITRYNEYFYFVISTVDSVKILKSLDFYADDFVMRTTDNFLLSQTVSHSHSSYYFKLGLIKYTHADIHSIRDIIKQILCKSRYSGKSDQIINNFLNKAFNVFISKASDFVNEQNYNVALGYLYNAGSFYIASTSLSIPLTHVILTSRANYGIYDSYLRLIDKAFELGNYEMAENYTLKALAFQKENQGSIISDHYLTGIAQKLIDLYVEKGNLLNQTGEFKNAMGCFEHAYFICSKIERFNNKYEIDHGLNDSRNGLYKQILERVLPELERGNYVAAQQLIDRAKSLERENNWQIYSEPKYQSLVTLLNEFTYRQLIEKGRKLLDSGNYHYAYKQFLEAVKIREKSEFNFDLELDCCFELSAIPVLLEMCNSAEVKIRKNNLVEARSLYNQCLGLQNKYGLDYEPTLQKKLTLLDNHIFEKQCEYEILKFNRVVDSFWVNVKVGDFRNALEILCQAETLSNDHYYCSFDEDYIKDLQAKYQPLAEYQALEQKARESLILHESDQFNGLFNRMQFYSRNNVMIRNLIETVPMAGFLSVKKNLDLLESYMNNITSGPELITALQVLATLEQSRLVPTESRHLQKKLGNILLKSGLAGGYGVEYAALIDEYISNKDYYKYLIKASSPEWWEIALNKIPLKFAWVQDRLCILASRMEKANAK